MEHQAVNPIIELLPMTQRFEAHSRKEDWTGKSSTALRRKLQNRLNQRASRKRRGIATPSTTPPLNETPPSSAALEWALVLGNSTRGATESAQALVSHVDPKKRVPEICIHHAKQLSVVSAPDFSAYTSKLNLTLLPCDQTLLTLLHFNLVRAVVQNVYLLGLDPDEMVSDIESPFSSRNPGAVDLGKLPPMLRPTTLQRTVPHHPEIDVFPFPAYRDNAILAGDEIDDNEICNDMLYGVEYSREDDEGGMSTPGCKGKSFGGRTGLIVWGDPWLASSWEVEEGFARKYRRLLLGCDDLLKSTNFWRERRGEARLVLDDE